MAVNIKVVSFYDEKVDENNTLSDNGTLKKQVTLEYTNTNYELNFISTKWLTISDSKTDDDYVKEAYDLCKSAFDNFDAKQKNIGKTFNPETGKME